MSGISQDSVPPISNEPSIDEIYLRVWEKQQELVTSRWSVITFFMSVSFAIFGLSFQSQNLPVETVAQRIVALAIYWFSYLLYRRYSNWSHFLRAYLEELETTSSTRIDIQSKAKQHWRRFSRWTSVNKLIIYFGLLYGLSILLLWQVGI